MILANSHSQRPLAGHLAMSMRMGSPGRNELLVLSESDGFAEQQDGAAPGVGLCVEDEQAVDGAGLPVGHLGAGAFQWEAVPRSACGESASADKLPLSLL
jgi:hypothetical protein